MFSYNAHLSIDVHCSWEQNCYIFSSTAVDA